MTLRKNVSWCIIVNIKNILPAHIIPMFNKSNNQIENKPTIPIIISISNKLTKHINFNQNPKPIIQKIKEFYKKQLQILVLYKISHTILNRKMNLKIPKHRRGNCNKKYPHTMNKFIRPKICFFLLHKIIRAKLFRIQLWLNVLNVKTNPFHQSKISPRNS